MLGHSNWCGVVSQCDYLRVLWLGLDSREVIVFGYWCWSLYWSNIYKSTLKSLRGRVVGMEVLCFWVILDEVWYVSIVYENVGNLGS